MVFPKAEPEGRPMRALDRLAERLGVEREFQDASGELRRPSARVKRQLLAAMGVKVARPAEAEHALEEIERLEWSETLHAAVVRESALPAVVPLTLPVGTGKVAWRVEEEDGTQHSGTVEFAALELIDHRRDLERRRLVIDAALPLGYHRLTVRPASGVQTHEAALIVVPERCYVPAPILRGERMWGLTAQLYALRSERNWGIGDFTDLAELCRIAGRLGAATIGLNPLHAAFLHTAGTPSPYSPASRLLLNSLYIDVTAIPELDACPQARARMESTEFKEALARCRAAKLIDHAAIERLKLPLLEQLFETFEHSTDTQRREAFEAFCRREGEELRRFALWQALHERFVARRPELHDWHRWPRRYRDPASPSVVRFASRNAQRIRFFEWLQWVAHEQLEAAAQTAHDAGLAIGLVRDLAVGAAPNGAEAWGARALFASGASVGAPADLFNPAGQDWGLPPFDPHALRRSGYAPFIELIRANMRYAGGLRIDHAMGLQHLYWVSRGRPPAEGAYITYPLDELVGVIALESVRHQAIVVGEDLGTVPDGFREHMRECGVFSYRILLFEQDDGGRLVPPEAYPGLAVAAVGSHDLAPLRGWWEGLDLERKREHGLYPSAGVYREQLELRARERAILVESLDTNGIALPEGFGPGSPYDGALAIAVHAFLARTRAALAAVQIEDLVEESELVNLPGCTEGYPSWRRRLDIPLERLESRPLVALITSLFRKIRSGPRT